MPLTPHPTLNGAYFFDDWAGMGKEKYRVYDIPEISTPEQRTIFEKNKIYTSEVNNPFVFPSSSVNTVGTGDIIATCAIVKALSQGQFGQFPLYAFTDEGVWALEVGADGKYTAKHPVTRDVCINPDSITQIDTAVLFATERGIMMLSGSNSVCISDIINSKTTFSIDSLPYLKQITQSSKQATSSLPTYIPFHDFIRECRMLYDYTQQRIIVYNPNQKYAYIYSLKSKQWGMMEASIVSSVNSYPYAYAMVKNDDGKIIVVDYSSEDFTSPVKGVVVTRPLKLDAPDILKTVNAVIQRGYFKTGHIKTLLYGSRDLLNWHLITSSNTHRINNVSGTPYKYFRIVLLCDFGKEESVSGCSLEYKQRFINRLR